MRVREGKMAWQGFETYYRIVEPESAARDKASLVLLHGGPGSTHNYFELLDELAEASGRSIVMYDQLGCGLSWDDRMAGMPELWQAGTWLDELARLREDLGLAHVHLLGQSWGGMLAIMYLCDRKARGVESVILSSTLASASLWSAEGHRRLRYLSAQEQEAYARAEASGRFDDPEFRAAEARLMELFSAGEPDGDSPECLRRPKRSGREAYVRAWGDNELMPSGTLAGYEYAGRLDEVSCPALVISGTQDLCSPLVAKQLTDGIADSRWELFANCRHMCFAEDRTRYLDLLCEWLAKRR